MPPTLLATCSSGKQELASSLDDAARGSVRQPGIDLLREVVTGDVAGLVQVLPRLSSDPSLLARYAALAAANGQLEILRCLHESGADILAEEQLPLRLAAACGWIPVLDYLVEHGATPNRYGDALVKSAARAGHVQMLARLRALGCSPKVCGEITEELVSKPSLEPVLHFLEGEIPDGLPLARLIDAIRQGSRGAVAAALAGDHLKAHAGLLLETAVRRGSPQILRLFYESGAEFPALAERLLCAAAENGQYEILELLIRRYGCDPSLTPIPTDLAAENGHIRCLELLWRLGAEKNPPSPQTLKLATINGHEETFDYLTYAVGMDGIREDRETIGKILEEVLASPEIYRPSELWKFYNDVNLEQLRRFGMHRFKRTINQNYFNYLPLGLRDPQLAGLIRQFSVFFSVRELFAIRLVDPDRYSESDRLVARDARVFRLWQSFPLLSPLGRWVQRSLYRLLVALLWRYATRNDPSGLCRDAAEPKLGSPIVTDLDGRLVSQDLAHSILECNSILGGIQETAESPPLRIAEIGAGYGRVGDVLLSTRRCRYFVFDIPPGLYVSQWYLSRRHPFKRIFAFRHIERFEDVMAELEAADIAFFTPNQIALFPDGYFDIALNISSLHEMRHEQMRHMLSQMYRVASRRTYLKQYRHYVNPWDKIEILESDYFVPEGWKRLSWRTDPVDARNFEAVLVKSQTQTQADAPAPVFPPDVSRRRPTISILLVNYNDARYLHTSLEGILAQTDPADEIIVVDDGSTDESVQYARTMLARHPNAHLIQHGRNRGQNAAIQRALVEATSDYVVWASSDDLLLPRFIERSREVLARYLGCGICFSQLCAWREGTREVVEYSASNHDAAFNLGASAKYYSPDELREILRNHYLWISGNTVLARRDLLIEMGGFDPQLRRHADWFSFYAIALRAGACGIPETLAMMRERGGAYSRSGAENRGQQANVLRMLLDTSKQLRHRELLAAFRESPSTLGPFGRAVASANIWRVRHFDFILPLLAWRIRRKFVATIRNQLHRCRVILVKVRDKWRAGRTRSR